MGKKDKIGKSRKDKYYHLAKESGYRARSAFKLLQLNRKFQFLEKCRVCIDLCAAPGGWLQVAQQTMPMSSVIIGVDLVPIKPIPRCITFQEDITTEKCRTTLSKELHTWKADVVLHDGAPNVGQNWLHDAFQQAQLTLQALKLATEFLKKGGWFVTKVFRSKDYNALLWVLKQLFKKVHATKPPSSRNESAEAFIVCQFYRAPDKLDPKFLDVKHVFSDVETETKGVDLFHPTKTKKSVDGYDENDTAFHNKLKASEYVAAENYQQLLSQAHSIVLDTDEIKKNPVTTKEVKACIEDIKVLGKKELKLLIKWRLRLNKQMDKKEKEEKMEVDGAKGSDEESSEDEEEEIGKQIDGIKTEQAADLKKKRKKVMREKRKLRDKMELKMVHVGDQIEQRDDIDLFDLKRLKKDSLKKVQGSAMPDPGSDSDSDAEADGIPAHKKKFMMAYDRYKEQGEDLDMDLGEDEDDDEDSDESSSGEEEESGDNPLLMDLVSKSDKESRKTDMWFKKDMFSGLEGDEDEDIEVQKMVQDYKKKGGTVIGSEKTTKRKLEDSDKDSGNATSDDSDAEPRIAGSDFDSDSSSDDSDSDDDSGSDMDVHSYLQRQLIEKNRGQKAAAAKGRNSKAGFEVVPMGEPAKKIIKLDPVELALGEELIKSSKRRRELEEGSFNRYSYGDEAHVPDWFHKDEVRHNRKPLEISKEQVDAYKERMKAIDARPIKKIAEAKARKKRKSTKKLERARKKAESISDSVETTDVEKWRQIKDIYKKAGLLSKKKKEVTYVVAKKGGGRKAVRPEGVKGFYKQVDKREKKDKRAEPRGGKGKGKGKGKGAKGRSQKQGNGKGRKGKR